MKSNQDTTAVAVALIQLVEEAVKSGNSIPDAFSGKAGGSGNRFGVYDIVFDNDGNITGLRPLVSDATLLKVPDRPTAVPASPAGAGTSPGGTINVN